ncbi:MAG TPA: signal peptidase I [Thermoleophilaceae bacterium]
MAAASGAVTTPAVAEPAARGARMFARACLTFALWVALGFGLGMAAIVTLPGVFGYQSLTVVSGSMVPTLGVGSVVIDEVISPAEARPGDIVTFKDPLHPRQLTHRLQKVRVDGDTFYMTTLGDANDVPEHWSVPRTAHIGRVVAHLPKLGYVRAWLGSRYARLGAGGIVLLLGALMLVDLWRPRSGQ